ncbi:bifunctional DNA-binding transcriptional regulator/O6-methylguanine-DNA methyltransferase Ada [Uliginosibacterium sp. H3]|uniref:Bifunctional DNA-binding transcriptional regulator/O6-methylguanine-DNA methyltransferase Ada n=1 Tax=Uliginosibacterium silvisoli TaxID=3114758 RepID=A0ABU6JZZ3_9RHOO|nr:bifunctional DNA-binding transcriptional regulator/O6-methylguanine-DNA methyltransferase Ada [Uliginosibacterium sp. H3]
MKASLPRPERAAATLNDPRWAAVAGRDATADGKFYYSVQTTGVYCRPSCVARAALPENVAFHATREAAEQAGFRPCKRCKPDQPALAEQHVARVTEACRIIERAVMEAQALPSLDALALQLGLSTHHFHRLFKSITGVTPKAYAMARRAERLRADLPRAASVTEAIFDAGYSSSGRFHADADGTLGMTPTQYKSGGADTQIRFAVGECSLGAILVAQSERGICAVLIDDDAEVLVRDLQDRFPRAQLIGGDAAFERLVAQVVGFVEAFGVGFALPLDVRGTAFQQRVWQALRDIPPGQTLSYSELAERIGAPKAVRAVAGACAANAIAVLIPCHRVVRNDGSISGYRWGVERKRALLDKEAAVGDKPPARRKVRT